MAGDTDVPSSQCDKNCEICGDSIRKTCVKCEGDNCNVILHTKCFETIAKIFFAERKNWRCKNCASKHRSTTGSTSSDVLILRHEVDCLTREKLLLNELNVELKSNNQLLREKLFSTQMSYAEKVKISPPGEIVRATTSYDNGKKVNKPTTGVVVKANSSSVSNDDIIADLQKNVNPPGLKLCLNGIKKIKNGVIIKCEDKKSQGILEEHVKNKLGSKYAINQTRLFKPRLLINNIRFQENATHDEILADLRTRNDIGDDEMKIVTTLKNGNTLCLVLEVSAALRKKLVCQGYIYVGFCKCSVTDHLGLLRCYKCSGLGHTEKNCKSSIVCPICSGEHRLKDCSSDTLKCINCVKNNENYRTKFNVNHSSSDENSCFVLQNYINRLKSNIDYGEETE
nr:unnamed protein product [Callosobruchus analis]